MTPDIPWKFDFLEPTTPPLIDMDFKSPMPLFIEVIREAEEKVLRNVLSQLLKREATNEDAKRLTIMYPEPNIGGDLYYMLAFDGVEIGRVFISFEPPGHGSVTFKPSIPL